MECKVCQSPKASKHSYYGATSICASCRGFFMRAVQSDTFKSFMHAHQCKVDSQSRTSCKKCRFDKCLEADMKISYVKTQVENCQKIIQSQKVKKVVLTVESFPERLSLLKLDEDQFEYSCNILYHQCYKQNPHAFIMQHCKSPPPQGLNTDHFLQFCEFVDFCAYFGVILLVCQEDDATDDIDILVRTNMPKLSTLYRALLFMENWADAYVDYGRKNRNFSFDINELMSYQDQFGRKSVRFEYDMFFSSPWASDATIEDEHRRLYKGLINWYIRANRGSTARNGCLLILIQRILVYNTDGIEKFLKNPTKIKNLQAHYCSLMHKFLRCSHPPEVTNILFGKAIMLIQETQRAYDLSKLRLKYT